MGQLLDPDPHSSYPVPQEIKHYDAVQGSITYSGPMIAGQLMPGRWLLNKSPREFGIQQQRGPFMNSAYIVPTGNPLVEFGYDIALWEARAVAVFSGLLKTLFKNPGVYVQGAGSSVSIAPAAALGIDDPILKSIGVKSCVVKSVQPPLNPLVSSGGKGPWMAHIDFIEFRPVNFKFQQPVNQDIPEEGAVTPSAASNLATAQA